MTEAYAIKGPRGSILFVEPEESIEFTWQAFNESLPTWKQQSADKWMAEGFTCVPVTVSENGEADDLLRECLDWGLPDDLKHRIDGYLSRGQR